MLWTNGRANTLTQSMSPWRAPLATEVNSVACFVSGVIEQLVEFGPGQHAVEAVALMALGEYVGQRGANGSEGGAQARHRIEHEAIPQARQRGKVERGAFAEFS